MSKDNLPATTTGNSVLERMRAKQAASKKDINKMSEGQAGIPFMKLIQALSNEAKPKNHTDFFKPVAGDLIVGKKVLGRKLTVIPVDYRAKAILFDGSNEVCYDEDSEDYERIAKSRNAEGKSNSAYGPELLLWVITEKECFFATYHMKGTASKHASSFVTAIGTVCTLYIDEEKNKKGEWFVPMCADSDYVLREGDQPTETLYNQVSERFNNPKSTPKAETLSDEDKGGKKRRKR